MRVRVLGIATVLVLCLTALPALAGDLVLKRVMLSTGGVAYLEYEAEVTGDQTLSLDVRLDQVDDILKSIVVYDSKGGVGSASLAGREPLEQVFADLPFSQAALASPAALLNALQGAEIRVGSSHPIDGKLIKVVPETVRANDGTTTTRNRVSVLTSDGIQQFILEDAENLRFADPALSAQVEKALTAIATHRAKDRRTIQLTTRGDGQRIVRVGYVVAAPLWKASYRLTLARDPNAAKAHLQGWAVLENLSGEDWKGVELTLLSGNPVSFRQAIYQAYYVDRPEVPVEVAGRILPQTDTGNLNRERPGARGAAGAPAPAPPPVQAQQRSTTFAYDAVNAPSAGAGEQTPAPTVNTAEAEESMTQVLFRLPAPLTLASGQSALVPIVDRDVPAQRIDLLQPATNALHPLAAVRLTNDSGNGLPPGVVTLYEQANGGSAYLGDARVGVFPAGENRLLSYAVDDKTKSVREPTTKSALSKAAISEGVLYLTYTERQTIVFRLNAPAGEARHVLVEQPMLAGWKLVEPAEKSVETTATAYRVAVDLKPGEAKTVTFVFEAPRIESTRIADFDDRSLAQVTATREIEPAVRNALVELARLRRVVAEKKQAEAQIKAEIAEITEDQTRVRANLESVDKESALHKRYIEKLAQEETRLETLQADRAKAADATRAAQAAVDAYIAKLSI
ncbi:MAG TPA: DUF4139 domain-containing protein [Stellaceae bacterium]|nr:DUF4139 domain-containing protein [Stellaceae bacterium]